MVWFGAGLMRTVNKADEAAMKVNNNQTVLVNHNKIDPHIK